MKEVIVTVEILETVKHKYQYKVDMDTLKANLDNCEAEWALNEINKKLNGTSDDCHNWDIFPYCENYAEELSHEERCDERIIQSCTVEKGDEI